MEVNFELSLIWCLNQAAHCQQQLYITVTPATSRAESKGGRGCTRPYLFQGFSKIVLQILIMLLIKND